MKTLKHQLDQLLLDLVWSAWTELGVQGVLRNHQNWLIMPEELILLTSVLGEIDFRLRDEALDWCSRNHHFISLSRLKTIAKSLRPLISAQYSTFAATLNACSSANWPLLEDASPLQVELSGKSQKPPFASPSLILFRLRGLLGVGARADLLLFFLARKQPDLAISDTVEIGYTKRNLAEILDYFTIGGICDVFLLRNQKRFSIKNQEQWRQIVSPLPAVMPSWRDFIELILNLRFCIHSVENKSDAIKTVEIRNTLSILKDTLHKLKLSPPPMQTNMRAFLDDFATWILQFVGAWASPNS